MKSLLTPWGPIRYRAGPSVDKNLAQSRFLEGLVRDSPNVEFLVSGPLPKRGCANHRARASPQAFSLRITESCFNGTIIVIIMKLCNLRVCINISGTLGTG